GARRARPRAHARASSQRARTYITLTAQDPLSTFPALRILLRSRLIGKPPDSGSGHWRFESSLLSDRGWSHRLAARTPASHVRNGGSIPPGTTSRSPIGWRRVPRQT